MKCEQARELMDRSLDVLIKPSDEQLLDAHLSVCERCSGEYTRIRRLDQDLSEALPLQVTVGDGFAERVAAKLPAKRGLLPTLKEALHMSRLKYAAIGVIILLVGARFLFPPRSSDAKVFAAVQDAMSKVQSMHYIVTSENADAPGLDLEVWSTPDATKSVLKRLGSWTIYTGSVAYHYRPDAEMLFILPITEWSPAQTFAADTNPRSIADTEMFGFGKAEVSIDTVESDGRPMMRVTIIRKHEPSAQYVRVIQKMHRAMQNAYSSGRERANHDSEMAWVTEVKTVYLVDPSTNLVHSLQLLARSPHTGWLALGETTSIEYNVDLPPDFFDVPELPEGTKTVDLRDDADLQMK